MDAFSSLISIALLVLTWLAPIEAMRPDRIAELRNETVEMFYHGFDNYMKLAFPEDEVRWQIYEPTSQLPADFFLCHHSYDPSHARP